MISLYQIGTSKGALLIHNNKSPVIKTFLTTHTFYMKDPAPGNKKLSKLLGPAFSSMKIIDVEKRFSRLNKYSNKLEKIVETHVGKPSASFEHDKIKKCRLSVKLYLKQICYALFDVVGLYESLAKMIQNGIK